MHRVTFFFAVLQLLLGCSSPDDQSALSPTSSTELGQETSQTSIPSVGDLGDILPARDFQLYTHCGVNGAMIDGRWWQISPSLDDGDGNPPPPWDNPFQNGVLRFTSDDTAIFTADESRPDGATPNPDFVVTLHRTDSTDFPFICS